MNYISEKDKATLQKIWDRHQYEMFFGIPNDELKKRKARRKLNEDYRKYAYVYVGRTHKMVMVDNKTMIAYKLNHNMPTATYIRQPYTKFDRWCTGHDL